MLWLNGLFCAQLPLNCPPFIKNDFIEIPAIAMAIKATVKMKVGNKRFIYLLLMQR